MQCPPEIAEVVHEILRVGILRIRACGWNHDPGKCAIEADHLHNLPALLADFRPEMLDYYMRVEIVSFANRSSADDIVCFQPMWDSLAKHSTNSNRRAIAG